MTAPSLRRRDGFTLLEILVALVLIGLLAGAIVPSVLNQLDRGDTNRAVEDLTAIETAAKAFRVDVRRWPGDVEDLVVQPVITGTPADTALVGTGAYTAGLVSRWKGPYLERVSVAGAPGSLPSPIGGTIQGRFVHDAGHFVIEVTGLADDQIAGIDLAVDATPGLTAGRVRATGTPGSQTLRYLASPAS